MVHGACQWSLRKLFLIFQKRQFLELREYYPDVLPAENHSLAETLARINTVTGRKFYCDY
mgnify:CR=1 FL=1